MYRVGDQIAEAVRRTKMSTKAQARGPRASSCSKRVGIPNAASAARDDYPHQFSGGMRQRAMIAMALVHNPDVLIADEPTTALDVTVQAQILELIDRVKQEFDVGVILITHDLGVVAETATHVMVMYAGRVDGVRRRRRDLQASRSTRTRGGCSSRCRRSRSGSTVLIPIEGSPPSLLHPPSGLPVPSALQVPLRAVRPEVARRSTAIPGGLPRCLPPRAGAQARGLAKPHRPARSAEAS